MAGEDEVILGASTILVRHLQELHAEIDPPCQSVLEPEIAAVPHVPHWLYHELLQQAQDAPH